MMDIYAGSAKLTERASGGVLDLGWASAGETLATVVSEGYPAIWDSMRITIERRILNDPASIV